MRHYLLGDFAEGRKACQQGMGFEHIQAWRMLGYISSYYAMNAAEMGLLGETWQFGQKAIEIDRRQGHGEVVGLGHKAIGDLYFRLGLGTQAMKSYQQGMTSAGEHFIALENMHHYGYLLFRQGQTAMGKEYLQRALNLSEQSGLWSIYFLASIHDLETHIRYRYEIMDSPDHQADSVIHFRATHLHWGVNQERVRSRSSWRAPEAFVHGRPAL